MHSQSSSSSSSFTSERRRARIDWASYVVAAAAHNIYSTKVSEAGWVGGGNVLTRFDMFFVVAKKATFGLCFDIII